MRGGEGGKRGGGGGFDAWCWVGKRGMGGMAARSLQYFSEGSLRVDVFLVLRNVEKEVWVYRSIETGCPTRGNCNEYHDRRVRVLDMNMVGSVAGPLE